MNEIIIEHGTKADVIDWLGEAKKEEPLFDGCSRIDFLDGTTVILTEGMEERDWLSVAFPDPKWKSDLDCARDAKKKRKKLIMCDPQDGDLDRDKFIVLDGDNETTTYIDLDER